MLKNRLIARWLDTTTIENWSPLEAVLDAGEHTRANRFHFSHDRHSYIAAHALARTLLSEYAGEAPSSWRFITTSRGKPEVASPPGQQLRLNLTHTRGLAAVALTDTHDIGIDAEWLNRRPAIHELAERYFTPSERQQITTAPPALAHQTFLSIWTLKEAYLKATGQGLSHALDSFAVSLTPPRIHFTPASHHTPQNWLLQQLHPTAHHILALAMHHPHPTSITLDASPAKKDFIGSDVF